MTGTKSPFVRGAIAVAAFSALAFATPLAAEEIKIGGSFGLTGGLAPYSPSIVDGARLAVQQVNDAGGILDGQTLELVVVDDQTNPQAAVDAAQKLVSIDNIVAMVGPLGSGQVMAVANNVTIPANLIHVAPTATSPALTDLEDNDFIFRTVPSDAYVGMVMADVVLERGVDTIAVMYLNNDYGVGLAETFETHYTQGGGTITGKVAFEPNKQSYRGELAGLAGDASMLLLIAYPADGGITIIRQSLENGFFESFVLSDGMREQSILDAIGGENLAGSFGLAPEAPSETDAVKAFNDAYSAFAEHPLDSLFIRETYDATMLLALAIQAAGSTDSAAIRDALRMVATAPGEPILPGEWAKAVALLKDGQDIDYVGAAGPMEFDEAGDVAGSVGLFEIDGDSFNTIEVISN